MDKNAKSRMGEGLVIGIVSSIIATILVAVVVMLISHLDSTWTKPIVNGFLAGLLTLGICIGIMILRVIPKTNRPTTFENVEGLIREWLDNFGFSVKREPIPEAHFRYIVETGGKLRIILGRLKNDLSSYILLRLEIGPDDNEKQIIASLTDEERSFAMVQTKLELNRISIGYEGFTSLDSGFSLTKRIPISSELTEDDLITAIGEIEAAYHLVFLTGSLFMAQKDLKTQPKILEAR